MKSIVFGALAFSAFYKAGVKDREKWTGEMPQAEFEKAAVTPYEVTIYPPIPPLWEMDQWAVEVMMIFEAEAIKRAAEHACLAKLRAAGVIR